MNYIHQKKQYDFQKKKFFQTLEKERVDEMSDVAHHTTKKVGGVDNKAKKRPTIKLQRAETRPAPHGQRITPVIDPALVKKVNEEILKRSKVSHLNILFNRMKFSLGRKNS